MLGSELLVIEILHDLIYQNTRKYGSIVYDSICKAMQDIYEQQYSGFT